MAAVEDDAWLHPENPSRRGFEMLPDIEGDRAAFDIVSADVRRGDVLVFHGLTLHYSAGNADPTRRRRAISLRYAGEAARFTPRNKGIASGWPAPGPEALLTPGSPLTCEIWPVAHDSSSSMSDATTQSESWGAARKSSKRARDEKDDEDALAEALEAGAVGGAKRWRHARGGCAWEI